MTVRIERVEANLENAQQVYAFIRPMALEVALAPVDDVRAFQQFCGIIDEGHTFIAIDGDEIVGALGLTAVPYWYSDGQQSFLIDKFFYVRPDRRFGDIGIKLLRAGRDEGKRVLKSVFVMVANPDRSPKQNAASAYAVVAGYSPFAHLVALHHAPVAGNA